MYTYIRVCLMRETFTAEMAQRPSFTVKFLLFQCISTKYIRSNNCSYIHSSKGPTTCITHILLVPHHINNMPNCSYARTQLKWPNDIYGPGMKKLGGVLCESKSKLRTTPGSPPSFHICAGVGLNIFNSEPTT